MKTENYIRITVWGKLDYTNANMALQLYVQVFFEIKALINSLNLINKIGLLQCYTVNLQIAYGQYTYI